VPAYSNYGYALAGYLVERVSGTPFDEYVDHNVLDRSGMASSSFVQPLPQEVRGRAKELVIETSTVKSHLGRIMATIGVRDRLQTVVWAYQNGMAPQRPA
jgi:CubicO group peptidase (beta-lactamase class C family)